MSPAPHSPGHRPDDSELLSVLSTIRDRGPIGEHSLAAAIAHADQYVAVLATETGRLVDLGSGGGLPGLVIAVRRPDLRLTLVERRASRADLLRRAVLALGLGDRVEVCAKDVEQVTRREGRAFRMATARSFAAPAIAARWAGRLLVPGGLLVVSEPPTDDPLRWPAAVLSSAGLVDQGRDQGLRCFRRL